MEEIGALDFRARKVRTVDSGRSGTVGDGSGDGDVSQDVVTGDAVLRYR